MKNLFWNIAVQLVSRLFVIVEVVMIANPVLEKDAPVAVEKNNLNFKVVHILSPLFPKENFHSIW